MLIFEWPSNQSKQTGQNAYMFSLETSEVTITTLVRYSGKIQNVNAEAEIEVIFVVEDAIESVHSDDGKEIEKPVSCTWKGN